MFNREFIAKVMDEYQCDILSVDRNGTVYAQIQSDDTGVFVSVPIPGLVFDTDTADGTAAARAADCHLTLPALEHLGNDGMAASSERLTLRQKLKIAFAKG